MNTKIIDQIAARADETIFKPSKIDYTPQQMAADIKATIEAGSPIKLEELLAADHFNFSHDVCGIRVMQNPTVGKLPHNFELTFI